MTYIRLFLTLAVWTVFYVTSAQNDVSREMQLLDEFDGDNLNQSRWTFVNPLNDGQLSIGDGLLRLSVPDGVAHGIWGENLAPRIMQSLDDVDFTLEVRFESQPVQRFQGQGIVIEESPDRWLRFEVYHDDITLRLFAGIGSSRTPMINVEAPEGALHYLRVDRAGDTWTLLHSTDGDTWTEAGQFDFPLVANSAGVYVMNAGPSPAFTAIVDHFRLVDEPLGLSLSMRPRAADSPPFIHSVQANEGNDVLIISWFTDEPSLGMVEYGKKPSYDAGWHGGSETYTYAHYVELTGFSPGETVYYRVSSVDMEGQRSTSGTQTLVFDPHPPDIEVWYGDHQQFGQHGSPQTWVNILGNVQDEDGIASLVYVLNGNITEALPLSVGPDTRRLQDHGDFNIDIDTERLVEASEGVNTVEIIATDRYGNTSRRTVTVTYQPDVPSLPYTVDWASFETIHRVQDVAHIIDGRWMIENGQLRTQRVGYDRVVGIGDVTWQDYEVTVPVTIHRERGDGSVGIVLRWTGHTDLAARCEQPKCGYLPVGTITWYSLGNQMLNLFDDDARLPYPLEIGRPYIFKARVQTVGDLIEYHFKVWPQDEAEPDGWLLTATDPVSEMPNGSVLLVSHWVDVSFGNVTIAPLPE